MTPNKKLETLRKNIDSTDEKILKLLAERMNIVQEIALLKKSVDVPMLDEKRWKEVIDSKRATAKQLGLSLLLVADIYECIHKESQKLGNRN